MYETNENKNSNFEVKLSEQEIFFLVDAMKRFKENLKQRLTFEDQNFFRELENKLLQNIEEDAIMWFKSKVLRETV